MLYRLCDGCGGAANWGNCFSLNGGGSLGGCVRVARIWDELFMICFNWVLNWNLGCNFRGVLRWSLGGDFRRVLCWNLGGDFRRVL